MKSMPHFFHHNLIIRYILAVIIIGFFRVANGGTVRWSINFGKVAGSGDQPEFFFHCNHPPLSIMDRKSKVLL